MKILKITSVGQAVMSALCIFFLLLSIIVPVFFLCKVGLNYKEITKKKYKLVAPPPGSLQ